jgi:branched-chain amino acid transport system permease protein
VTGIGIDEWAAVEAERTTPKGPLERAAARVGWWPRLAVGAAIGALVPTLTGSDYWVRVGVNTLLLAMLAVGLNIVVGWAGLLDLGYIAFYGFGAYAFALISSPQIAGGIHLQSELAILIVVVAAALLGLVIGLPSRRLFGDYLAIVTLFFGQVFVEAVTNVKPSVTGGPNGIVNVDPISIFGAQLTMTKSYYYLLLVVTVLLIAGLHLLDSSRTGRAWRAVREDTLAAEHVSIPVNRVKLMAFGFGAAIAALTGTIFAGFQAGVYPTSFDTPFLILVYAAVILGGSGSVAGAVLGAVVVSVTLELLRTAHDAEYIFYGVVLLTLVARLRPWRKLALVLGSLVAFGFALHAIVVAVASRGSITTAAQGGGWISRAISHWVIVPTNATTPGNLGIVALVVALVALVQVRGRRRAVLLVPVLYLAAFVWEARLIVEPSITRQILLGCILIVTMLARPHGLLGARRVELA